MLVLLLEQGDRCLEDHTRDFVDISNFTHYLESSLCSFYIAGLNNTARAKLPGEGSRGSFAAFVEWVLVSNGSSFTVGPADEDATSPTPDPESSLPSPHRTEQLQEPTADGEPMLATNSMPEPGVATVHAAARIRGSYSGVRGHERKPCHTPTTKGEQIQDSDIFDSLCKMDCLFLPSPLVPLSLTESPKSPELTKFPELF